MKQATLKETPLELTKSLRDVSVTERGAFRTCRRRWHLETVDNLTPKAPTWALVFGTAVHSALEALYLDRYRFGKHRDSAIALAESEISKWHKETLKKTKKDLGSLCTSEVVDEIHRLRDLGIGMINNYISYDKVKGEKWKVRAVEGAGIEKLIKSQPKGYPEEAEVQLAESGRFLVPVVAPDTKKVVLAIEEDGTEMGPVFLTARLDLIVERPKPYKGLWVVDHKTAAQSPSDRGIDFDDQITGYCYVMWRLTGIIPRGIIYNVLVKKEPVPPKMIGKEGKELSADKSQTCLPSAYKEKLLELGLMKRNRVTSEKHAACYAALLQKGWDPFFRRFEVSRNEQELLNFERRLYEEYADMEEAHFENKLYPNPSTMLCPQCPVSPICQAMEDGSDYEHIIQTRFMEAEDRKAV